MILNPKKAQAASPSDPGTRVLNLNLFFKKPQFI